MILETFKAAVYILPFIKELILGKSTKKGSKDKGRGGVSTFLLQTIVTVMVLSLFTNFVLVQRVFTMGSMVVTLKRELAEMKAPKLPEDQLPIHVPRPVPPPVPVEVPKPAPTPQQVERKSTPPREAYYPPVDPSYTHPPEKKPAVRDHHLERLRGFDDSR